MAATVRPPELASRARSLRASPVRDLLALTSDPAMISFAGGLPAAELLDAPGLRRAFDAVLRTDPGRALQYSSTEGDPDLRRILADQLGHRGLPSSPDDLLVTTGSQQALTLVTAALVEPGDVVLVEEPTYLAALQCLGLAGARIVPVPGDDDGILPDRLADIVVRTRPKLLYVIPTFHNPTGRTMTAQRRRAVAAVAARRGLWIVEDDPYGELRFDGSPQPWIAACADAHDRAVLLGSLSKTMAPGLRLGWLRAPASLRRACVIAKQAADLHTSTIDQAAAARYLADGDSQDRLAAMCAAYRDRRDAMLAALPQVLPAGSRWNRPEGGMFVWARLPDHLDAGTYLPAALAHQTAYTPGAPFFAGPVDRSTLRLSFTTHPPARIATGLSRLARAFADAEGRS